jgi:secondary thiamine-phosphate synthase enzyme
VRQSFSTIEVETRAPGLVEITGKVEACVADSDVTNGLVTVFIRHTSASLVIQENADPDVRVDLEAFLSRIVPEDPLLYRHNAEGADDMPAHIRSALTATQLSIPLRDGRASTSSSIAAAASGAASTCTCSGNECRRAGTSYP